CATHFSCRVTLSAAHPCTATSDIAPASMETINVLIFSPSEVPLSPTDRRMPKRHCPLDKSDPSIEDRTCDRRNRDFGPDHVDVHAPDLSRNAEPHSHHRRAEKLGD